MPADIPGYFYDEVKKKYFKIQDNQLARPGAPYTKKDVKQRKADMDEANMNTAWQNRISKERIHKAEILEMPLCTVSRETGIPIFTASARKDFIARQYVSQVTHKTIHDFHAYPSMEMNTYCVDGVLRDPRHGALIQLSKKRLDSWITISFPVLDEDSQWKYTPGMQQLVSDTRDSDGSQSFISLSPSGHLLTGMNNPHSGICRLSAYKIPEPDEGYRYHRPIFSNVTSIYTRPRISCYNATAEPTGFTPKFAIATAKGLHIMEAASYRWDLQRKQLYVDSNENQGRGSRMRNIRGRLKDTDWMTPTVVVSGGSDPFVFLNDLRSNGGARPISLKSAVCQVQKANENSIVVSVYGDHQAHVEMFDLRYLKESQDKTTKPVLSFYPFSFPCPSPTFDVNPRLGVLAAISTRRVPYFFSLQTGRIIGTPNQPQGAHCLKFDNGEDMPGWRGPRGPSLLVGTEDSVQEWSC